MIAERMRRMRGRRARRTSPDSHVRAQGGLRRDRGAVLVEITLIAPLFIGMVLFIFEMGLLFRDSLTTDNASRQAARAASAQGRNPSADFYILRSAEHGLAAMGLESLEYVVVFKASGPGDTVPSQCRTASQQNLCNRYEPADFFASLEDSSGNDTGNFRCGSLDFRWCPSSREARASVGPDYVGVHVETRHRYLTNFFSGPTTLGSTTILRIEPDQR